VSGNISVLGIYPTRLAVEEGVEALRSSDYAVENISVLLQENIGSKDLGVEKHSKAAEGMAAGAASGALIGGALGWLTAAGLLAIPGAGPILAAGPIIGLLTGVGVVGMAGGIVGALIGLGIPEYEAKRYEGRIREGGILLSVHCEDSGMAKRAKQILDATGAIDISATGEAKADYTGPDKPRVRASGRSGGL
jgi:hypothetical protein